MKPSNREIPSGNIFYFTSIFLLTIFNVYLFGEREGDRERERERERTLSRLHAASTEPHTGFQLMNHEMMT